MDYEPAIFQDCEMMNQIYLLGLRDGAFLETIDDSDEETLENLGDRPISATWQPLPVQIGMGERERTRPPLLDFAYLSAGLVGFSEASKNALEPLISNSGEFLELYLSGGEKYYVFHVTAILDAFDRERSVYNTMPDSGIITSVRRHVFVPSVIEGYALFKLPELPTYYVAQQFVDTVEAEGLEGCGFIRA